jgi:DnaJ-class molecular chaperone
MNYYEILDATVTDSIDIIKRKYKKLAIKYHPDKNRDKNKEKNRENNEKFNEITTAYEILSDETKKQKYDVELNKQLIDIKEFFSTLNIFKNYPSKCRLQIELDLETLYYNTNVSQKYKIHEYCRKCKGIGTNQITNFNVCAYCNGIGSITEIDQHNFTEKIIDCKRCKSIGYLIGKGLECQFCNGNGCTEKERTIDIDLDKINGIEILYHEERKQNSKDTNGKSVDLEFKYKGHNYYPHKIAKSLFVSLRIKKHNKYHRSGDLLYITKSISLIDSLIGKPINLKFMKENITVSKRDEIIEPNTVITINNYGFYSKNGNRGKLAVKINLIFPANINKKHKQYIKCILEPSDRSDSDVGDGDGSECNDENVSILNIKESKKILKTICK